LDRVKMHLAPLANAATFVMGSRDDFVLLNRNPPKNIANQNAISDPASNNAPGFDHSLNPELCFAMTPQVHLFDNRTLIESLEGQAWILKTAGENWPQSKVNVTPITLKRTPLAMSIKKGFSVLPREIWKAQVDPRQFSLIGAGWTLGTLKNLALQAPQAGLSATFYETSGLLGLLAGEGLGIGELTVPGTDFKIESNWVYPLYHVFADFAEFAGGQVQDWISDSPLRFLGLALSHGNRRSLLIANLEETPGRICLESIGTIKGLRRLNEKNAMMAMENPEKYRSLKLEAPVGINGSFELDLLPFELVRLDLE
jgi:D-apionolactonase